MYKSTNNLSANLQNTKKTKDSLEVTVYRVQKCGLRDKDSFGKIHNVRNSKGQSCFFPQIVRDLILTLILTKLLRQ